MQSSETAEGQSAEKSTKQADSAKPEISSPIAKEIEALEKKIRKQIEEENAKEAKDPKAKAFAAIAKKVFDKIEELDKDSKTSISNKEASELLPTTKEAVKAEFAEVLGIETKGKKKVIKISQKDAIEAIARAYTAYLKLAPVKTEKPAQKKPSA